LFWFEVQRSREAIDRKYEVRLTNFRQVAIFGSFWLFEEGDFGYVAEEISRQILLDNRLIALSLAFNLYIAAKQPPAWHVQLKKLVADNEELSEQLDNYLRQPTQSEDLRHWKKEETKWKRRRLSYRKETREIPCGLEDTLNNDLEEIRAVLQLDFIQIRQRSTVG
jgi:hypothetical protein